MEYTFRVTDATSYRIADYEIHADSTAEAWEKVLEYVAEDGWDEPNIKQA